MPIVAPVPTSPTVETTIKAMSDMRISQWCDRRLVTRRPRARAPVRARGRFLWAARRDLQDVWYDACRVLWVGSLRPAPHPTSLRAEPVMGALPAPLDCSPVGRGCLTIQVRGLRLPGRPG